MRTMLRPQGDRLREARAATQATSAHSFVVSRGRYAELSITTHCGLPLRSERTLEVAVEASAPLVPITLLRFSVNRDGLLSDCIGTSRCEL